MYKVAFIDDGIMEGIKEVPEKVRKYKIINGKIQEKKESHSLFCLSHGTMCFWIFSEYINDKEYILYDIQILNELTSSGNLKDLIKALQFCLDEEVDLINMSLGITQFINEEDEVLKKLYHRGTIMVAAQNNSNQVTYPACSRYVLGVTRDYTGILKKDQFFYLGNKRDKIDIISHCEFSNIELKYNILMGKQNSFSTPYISALIYNELKKGKNRENILRFLKENSVYFNEINQWEYKIENVPDWQEEITAPVIGIEVTEENTKKYFMELISNFRREGFYTVGIWTGNKQIDDLVYIFQYFTNKRRIKHDMTTIVKWVFNVTKADIIFLGYNSDTAPYYDDIVDLILTDGIENNVSSRKILYIADKNIKQITEMVVSFFNEI